MFGKKDENRRFEVIYKEGTMSGCKVMIDRETGVHYLFSWDGYAGGITPLLGQDGKVIVQTDSN